MINVYVYSCLLRAFDVIGTAGVVVSRPLYVRGAPGSNPPSQKNTWKRIPLPAAWRRHLQCCSMTRANGGVLSCGPSQGHRKKALGLSNMRRHCVWVKDDDCGAMAESAAAPAAERESVTSKQSGGLRGCRSGPVHNLDRQRAVAEKMQSSSAVIEMQSS